MRIVKAVKRGNLPFLIVFVSCLCIFFSALAGIGYTDPEAMAPLAQVDFVPGVPVFDATEDQMEQARHRRMEEQRELERQWQKKKRPQDGAWMQRQRDDKAVRRVPLKPMETPVEIEMYGDQVQAELGSEDKLERSGLQLEDPEAMAKVD